ncbi:MAG: hypothetical protein FD157_3115 [Rhodocyclaceae bacterium]|nr:MAG: hypothetical protein FD157_3115 [Rhodocyclaceae bacterium]TND03722.1 MAG: hypothetical protein FD118_1140 [Rhodocyclaceae bacterium]
MGGMLVIGTGLAGLTVAETLRAEGYEGSIRLIGDEAHAPSSARRCPGACCWVKPLKRHRRCAPRKYWRRRTSHQKSALATRRIFINAEVCEGCGDCGAPQKRSYGQWLLPLLKLLARER